MRSPKLGPFRNFALSCPDIQRDSAWGEGAQGHGEGQLTEVL